MNQRGKKITFASLALLSLLVGVGGVIGPVFAWHIVTFTTTSSTPTTVAIGTGVSDTANLALSNNGGPYGTITFYIYSGSCNVDGTPTGTLVYTSSAVPVTSAATGSGGGHYGSGTVSTTGWNPGSYVWVAKYSGTGSNGYPAGKAACEPFSLFSGQPPPRVPEFPFGLAILMALAIPVMFVVKSKYAAQATR